MTVASDFDFLPDNGDREPIGWRWPLACAIVLLASLFAWRWFERVAETNHLMASGEICVERIEGRIRLHEKPIVIDGIVACEHGKMLK